MNNIVKLLCGAAMLPVCLYAQTDVDSIADAWERQFNLKEVVVTGKRPVVRQQEGKLVYMVRNDPYAKGLDGLVLLDRLPRVTVNNGAVSVAGKGSVRYIIDGILMELDATAMTMRLQNLRAENIEKIELLSTPPARYAVEPNAVYISITTRDESLGTRGSVYGSLNQADRMREYLSGSISHTTRHIGLSLDGSFSNYYSRNDNNMEFQGADTYRLSSTSNRSHMVDAGMNLLFRYKWTDRLCLGAIVNYNYGSTSTSGHNTSDYGAYTSTSSISTESRPNNALTLTGFLDWNLGTKGEKLELTYNYFTRHSPNRSDIATTLNNYASEGFVKELGKSDYRFHSGKADFKFPFPAVQVETGAAYTDIVNKSDNRMWQAENPSGLTRQGWADKFEYTERVAAAYITASRSLGQGWWAKAGLRYEYTWTEGRQPEENRLSHDGYGRLFPSVSLSWKSDRAGAFNASYSAGMGRPNLWELNPFRYYSTTAEYSAGNPSLTPTLYHNAEINYYGLGGLYAVVYTSFASDAIGYIRRFDDRGMLSTMPFNCLSTNKTGLYANYKLNLLDRWEVKGAAKCSAHGPTATLLTIRCRR